MKAYIMTDLEGVSGVNGRSDGIGNRIINTEAACRLLVGEVNAAVEGLADAGVDEATVVDGHGGSNSIALDGLHPNASLKTAGGGLAPVTWMDQSFDLVLQLGTHAMIGAPNAYMNHSFNSHAVANMWLNDTPVGEIAICAVLAAYFGVPTCLVSGDQAACAEALDFLGEVETVETKVAQSRYAVVNRNPVHVRSDIREAAARAAGSRADYTAKRIPAPYTLRIQLMCPNQADSYEMRGATRLDHQTVELRSDDLVDLWAQRNGWTPGVHNPRFGVKPSA